jgi:putative transposase
VDRQDPTRRQIRDAELVEIITAAREERKTGKFVQTLGSRKLWIWLRGQGHDVAGCTVERIMREQGWEGARYGFKHKTTIADDTHQRYPDLVDRRFYAAAPNRLWVADFVRREALFDRVEVRDHHVPAVAAAG